MDKFKKKIDKTTSNPLLSDDSLTFDSRIKV